MALAGQYLSAQVRLQTMREILKLSNFSLCIPRSEAFWVSGSERDL